MHKQAKSDLRVGDPVSFRMGNQRVQGVIVEDRGPLGAQGRRLYGVRYSFLPGEATSFELPEEDLTLEIPSLQPQSG